MAACSTTYCSFSLDTTTSRAQSYRYTRSSEEETEHKAKGQAKKEKHLAKEKGHAKPDSLLDKTERLRLVEDFGLSRLSSGETQTSMAACHLTSIMDHQGINKSSNVPAERKRGLGLHSRADPREIMMEVLKAL